MGKGRLGTTVGMASMCLLVSHPVPSVDSPSSLCISFSLHVAMAGIKTPSTSPWPSVARDGHTLSAAHTLVCQAVALL